MTETMLRLGVHIFLVCLVTYSISLILLPEVLTLKRSYLPAIFYEIFRLLVDNLLLKSCLEILYAGQDWFAVLKFFLTLLLCGGSLYFLWLYPFSEKPLEKVVFGFVIDTLSGFCGFAAISLCNLLQGSSNLTYLGGSITYLDFLTPVIGFAIFGLLFAIFRPFIRRVKGYEFRHRKIMWIVVAFFIIFSFFTNLSKVWDSAINRLAMFSVFLSSALFLVGIATSFYVWMIRQMHQKHLYLLMQRNLLEEYYQDMFQQMARLHEYRRNMILEEKKLLELYQSSQTTGDSFLHSYMEELEEVYFASTRTDFCEDPMTDALLHQEYDECQRHGIELKVFFPSMIPAGISPIDWISLLQDCFGQIIALYDTFSADQKSLLLEVKQGKNYFSLIFQLDAAYSGKIKWNRAIRTTLLKYQGFIEETQVNGLCQVVLVLPARSTINSSSIDQEV